MTTAWAHLMRGEVIEAARANLGGELLGLLAAVAAPWLLTSAAAGRWLGVSPNARTAAWVFIPILSATLIQWAFRLLAG
jgi:hypothetical protein